MFKSIKRFADKVQGYSSHVRWAYITVLVALFLFSFEILLSSYSLLLSRGIGVAIMGEWVDIMIIVAFSASVLGFVVMLIVLGIVFWIWGIRGHAEDTTPSDIKSINYKLDVLNQNQIVIARRLGVKRWKIK